jgi:protein-tyrosine phosphatase family protein
MFGDVLGHEIRPDTYGPMLDHNKSRIAAAFIAVVEPPPGGVLVRCHAGRDRTGALRRARLTVAGVAAEAVAEEYALSTGAEAVAMLNTLAHTDRRYGGVEPYLRSVGVGQHQIDAVRSRLRSGPGYWATRPTG